jgi:hypothetical protein
LDDPEPMGMKRMRAEEFPEVYPATTTEFAEAVEGDEEEVALFRPLLARTQLEEKELMLCFSAEECGWDADAFHRCVDSMGAAVRTLHPLISTLTVFFCVRGHQATVVQTGSFLELFASNMCRSVCGGVRWGFSFETRRRRK